MSEQSASNHSPSGPGLVLPKTVQMRHAVWLCLGVAVALILLRPLLPDWAVRVPAWMILPWADWLDAGFSYLQNETPLMAITRSIAEGLGTLIDTAANILYGKARWPRLGPLPWAAVAAGMAVLGYALGGWRLGLLAGGTFVWTALVGQWKWAMETMSVIIVSAPISFTLGLSLGVWA